SVQGLPLHRELQAPVTIGTQFSVRATPIEVDKHTVSFTLVTSSSEAALEITLHLPDKYGRGAKLRAVSRTATAESSPLEKEVSTIAPNKEFILGVIVKEHIYLDTIFLLPFVHRVNPSEIRKLVLDGSMICNEVVVVPVKTDMPRLPEYNEVSLNVRPPPPQQQQPQQQPAAPPAGAVAVLPPYPAGTLPGQGAPASSIAKPPEPGWTAPRPPSAPLAPPVPAPRHSPAAAAAQRPPRPLAPVVAPMPYGAAPLPPQGYPHRPQGNGPQFQNIQPIPGLSYAAQPQQPQQPHPYPQQVQQMQQPHQYPQQYQQYP
ncbi:hypothetical protein PFISCL1PPCAC_9638, partial [Pristionchus fissidentatus]